MKSYTFFLSYRAQFFLEREMLQTKIIEKIKTHILYSITFLNRKSCRWCDNVENIVEAGGPQMTISRTRFECWITKATYTHTHTHAHTICNTYCSCTATVVALTGLIAMLYVRILRSLLSFKRAQNAQLSTDVLKGWDNTTCWYVPCLCFPFVTTCFIHSLIPCLEALYTEKLSLCIVMLQGYDAVF